MAARDAFIRKLIFDPKYGAIAQFVREIPTNPGIRAVRVNRYIVPKKILAIFLRSRLPTYTRYRNDNELLQRIDQNRASDKNILWFTFSPNQILSDKTIEGFAKALNLPPDQVGQLFPASQPPALTEQAKSADQPLATQPGRSVHPQSNAPSRASSGPLSFRSPGRSGRLTPPTSPPQAEEPLLAPSRSAPNTAGAGGPPPLIPPISTRPAQPTPEPPFFAQETPEEPSEPPPSLSPPRIQIPSFALDMASNAKILMRRVLTKQIVQQSVIAGMGGGAAGILTFGLPGGVIGGLAGSALPTFRNLGGFKALGGFGGKALLGGAAKAGIAAAGVATGPPGWVAAAATLAPGVVKPIVKQATRTTLIIVLCIIGFILLAILIPMGGLNFVQNNALLPPYSQQTGTGPGASQQNRLEIVKSGPPQVINGGTINYTISVTYVGAGKADVTITDDLSSTIKFVSANEAGLWENPGKEIDEGGGKVTWILKELAPGTKKELTLTTQALSTADDSYVINQAKGTITNITGLTLGDKVIDVKSASLNELFYNAAKNAGLPLAFLKAIAAVETPGVLGYSDDEVRFFQTPNWWVDLPEGDPTRIRGYAYNTCADPKKGCGAGNDVRGPMQFELKTWNGVKGKLKFADGHEPARENLSDAVYGSAIFNKQNAVQYAGVTNESDWNEETVRKVARIYCAGPSGDVNNVACIAGGRTHDDLTWMYYQAFLGKDQ